jgi:hypothetical protein
MVIDPVQETRSEQVRQVSEGQEIERFSDDKDLPGKAAGGQLTAGHASDLRT